LIVALHQFTAGLYLVAGATAGAGLALRHPRLVRASVVLLACGAFVHAICFSLLHMGGATPALTDTASAISFMAWIGTLAFLLLLLRFRLASLVVMVAPMAFLGVFFASLRLPRAVHAVVGEGGSVPHAHVLLASSGLALLGLASLAGALFLAEHRHLKRKRSLGGNAGLPSLETLDLVGALALALGFLLLTLGVITGIMWMEAEHIALFSSKLHESLSIVAWGIYLVLVIQRFGVRQGPRQCATTSIIGFAFLCFAVLGVELLA
jgi:ABC-type uncharacterized transport system permease subunit